MLIPEESSLVGNNAICMSERNRYLDFMFVGHAPGSVVGISVVGAGKKQNQLDASLIEALTRTDCADEKRCEKNFHRGGKGRARGRFNQQPKAEVE